MSPTLFRKKPVVIEAMQWTGGDTVALTTFVGLGNWTRADAVDMGWDHEDDEEVVLWNEPERAHIPLPVGHWVIRGVAGEFYPCAPDVFELTYDVVLPTEESST